MDLDNAILDFPRPKTGIPRRCPLWPETVAAIRAALQCRPAAKSAEHAGLVFITKYGKPWANLTADNTLAKETGKVLKALGINGRAGLGLYTLRHTFRTIADESKDQPAVDFSLRHEVPHMSAVYRRTTTAMSNCCTLSQCGAMKPPSPCSGAGMGQSHRSLPPRYE